MKIPNRSQFAETIFFISILVLSAFAIGTFDEIYARHTEFPNVADPGFSKALVNGTNLLSYRDSSNMSPQVQGPTSPITPLILPTPLLPGTSVTVSITEVDSNLDATGVDKIFANITSTTQPEGLIFQLDENAANSPLFRGQVFFSSGFEPGKLRASPGDVVEVFYEPQHLGVGRLSATLINATDDRDVQLQDYTIDDPDGFNTRVIEACPYDLVVHPVEILIPLTTLDEAADAITVTISYANAIDVGPGETYQVDDLELLYRTGTDFGIGVFVPIDISSALVVNNVTKTITGTLLKGEIFPVLSGQYALGVDIAGCIGGGGGGLVRPGLVVNALAGLGIPSGGVSGPPGPTITLGALALSDSGSETISMPQEIRDIALDHDPHTPLEPITDIYEDFDLPLSINGKGFVLGDYENTLQPQTIESGEPTEFTIVYYTNSELAHSSLNFNLGPTRSISGSNVQILLWADKPPEIVDPYGVITSFTGSINNEGDLKRVATFSTTFDDSILDLPEPFGKDVVIRTWTTGGSSGDTIVYDAIEFAQPEIVVIADEDLPEPEIQTLKSQHVPIWIKNNAAWWSQELIDDSDFIAGIEYLIQQEIITLKDTGALETNDSDEIPIWIKNNAGWRSDNLISEKEFIDGLQWLITNGIVKVVGT